MISLIEKEASQVDYNGKTALLHFFASGIGNSDPSSRCFKRLFNLEKDKSDMEGNTTLMEVCRYSP